MSKLLVVGIKNALGYLMIITIYYLDEVATEGNGGARCEVAKLNHHSVCSTLFWRE